jgi:hypothetical protein
MHQNSIIIKKIIMSTLAKAGFPGTPDLKTSSKAGYI